MSVFEVVLPGFKGSTDATDDRVLWGTADTEEKVLDAFPDCEVSTLPDSFEELAKDFKL